MNMSIFALYEKSTKKVVGFLTEEQIEKKLPEDTAIVEITPDIERKLQEESDAIGGNIWIVDIEKLEFEVKEEKISYNPGPTQEERLNSLESALVALLMEV